MIDRKWYGINRSWIHNRVITVYILYKLIKCGCPENVLGKCGGSGRHVGWGMSGGVSGYPLEEALDIFL